MSTYRRINIALAVLVIAMLLFIAGRFRSNTVSESDGQPSGIDTTTTANENFPTGFDAGPLARQARPQEDTRESTESPSSQPQRTSSSSTAVANAAQDSPLDRAAVAFGIDAEEEEALGSEDPIEAGHYDDLVTRRASRLTSG